MNLFSKSIKPTHLIDQPKLATYIPTDSNRYQHILGVVQTMKQLFPQLAIPSEWKPMLLQACYLHDIGYSEQLAQYQYHPLDGAIFASNRQFPKPVVSAVLFHSGAVETVKQTRHDLLHLYQAHLAQLDQQDHIYIDLVTYCDLHTSPTGKPTMLEERIDEVVKRYGAEHEVSLLMIQNRHLFQETIMRVERYLK